MRDCLERIGDIVAVHPLPIGTITFDHPFNVRQSAVSAASILYDAKPLTLAAVRALDGMTLEGYDYNNVRANRVIVEPGITVKESFRQSAPGISYESKISLNSYADIDDLRDLVYLVHAAPAFDVLIVDSADNVFLLRGVEPATSITLSATLPVTTQSSVDIQVVSVNGIQPVIFP